MYTGSNPVPTSKLSPRREKVPQGTRAVGAVVARFLDTEEVTGSNPVSPTNECSPDKAKPWASQIQQMILTPETGRQPREAREVGWYNAARR